MAFESLGWCTRISTCITDRVSHPSPERSGAARNRCAPSSLYVPLSDCATHGRIGPAWCRKDNRHHRNDAALAKTCVGDHIQQGNTRDDATTHQRSRTHYDGACQNNRQPLLRGIFAAITHEVVRLGTLQRVLAQICKDEIRKIRRRPTVVEHHRLSLSTPSCKRWHLQAAPQTRSERQRLGRRIRHISDATTRAGLQDSCCMPVCVRSTTISSWKTGRLRHYSRG